MNNVYNPINKVISFLFLLFPFLLITGPAIPDIFVSLSAIYCLFLCIFYKKYIEIKYSFFLILFLFYFSIVLSSILSNYQLFSLESSVPYIRFIFFSILIMILVKDNNIFFKDYIFVIIFIAVLLVTLDTLAQFFFRTEIFGNKIDPDQNRLTGPFREDERIVGSYLSKFIFIAFGYLLYYFKNSKFIFLSFVFLLIVYICIFLTGERMAFITTTFGIFLLLFFNFRYLKFFILTIIFTVITSLFVVANNELVKNRMLNTTLQVMGFNYEDGKIVKYEYNFLDSHYGAHYLTAYEIFKDNIILGSGPKTFRIVCADDKYSNLSSKNIHIRCSTHPHNYYLQILSDAGIISLVFFLIGFVLFIIYLIKRLNFNNPLHNCTFITFLLFLWPIQSTGSIFNNWYGIYLFYYMGIFFILISEKKEN